jgi:tetratricopeptide (TPR) repeat protein
LPSEKTVGRIEMLAEFVAQNPNDPFPRYGLAMEYKNGGRLAEAEAEFARLIGAFPDYVPAYLHAGNVYRALKRLDRADTTYRAGIEAATRKRDPHARGELEAALAELSNEPPDD